MKKAVAGLGALALAVLVYSFAFSAKEDILAIGAVAPKADLEMMDVSGKNVSLKSAAKKNGLVVIFSCNTCPFVVGNGTKSEGWEGRYPEIADIADAAGMGMVLVNSNEAKREKGDGIDDMKARYKEKGLGGFYILDKNHELADAFGALTTPHVFMFDADMKLVYKGAIDDAVDSAGSVKEPYLKNAIEAQKNGKKIKPNSTRQLGCSIKRVS